MKKVAIVINHFQIQDGVSQAAIRMANQLCKIPGLDVTIIALFKYVPQTLGLVDSRVKVNKVFGFYFRGLNKILSFFPASLLSRMILGKRKYDLEIGYCLRLPIKIVAMSSNDRNNKITWMHGFDDGLSLKKYYLRSNKLVCVSESCAYKAKKLMPSDFKVEVANNLLDEKIILKKGEEGIEESYDKSIINFIIVGRLSKEKGHRRLVEAFARLKNDKFRFTLRIVGDGPEKNDIENAIQSLGLTDEVLMLGQKTNPYKYMAKSDVLICSSYTEGYNTTCAEAIILGVPVLTTDVDGAKEIVGTAKCGCVCENSTDGLYSSLRTLLYSPDVIGEWKKTLETSRKEFFLDKRVAKLKKVLGFSEL